MARVKDGAPWRAAERQRRFGSIDHKFGRPTVGLSPNGEIRTKGEIRSATDALIEAFLASGGTIVRVAST